MAYTTSTIRDPFGQNVTSVPKLIGHPSGRPLQIGLYASMPDPEKSKIDFENYLKAAEINAEITIIQPRQDGPQEQWQYSQKQREFYKNNPDKWQFWNKDKNEFDLMILSGGNHENKNFHDIAHHREIAELLDFLKENEVPTFASCLLAQISLKRFYEADLEFYEDDKADRQKRIGYPLHHDPRDPSKSYHLPLGKERAVFLDQHPANLKILLELSWSEENEIGAAEDENFLYMLAHPEYWGKNIEESDRQLFSERDRDLENEMNILFYEVEQQSQLEHSRQYSLDLLKDFVMRKVITPARRAEFNHSIAGTENHWSEHEQRRATCG